MSTTELVLSKDMRDSQISFEEVCAMAYRTALNAGSDSIQITSHLGWKRKYTLLEIRNFLERSPWHRNLLSIGETLGMDPVQKFRYRQQQFHKARGLFVPA